jgi:hypothetical protein
LIFRKCGHTLFTGVYQDPVYRPIALDLPCLLMV